MAIIFRDLTKDEIEVRVQSVTEKGVVLLLYKDARVDMNILDEAVGNTHWQRDHFECKGNLYCRVGINVAKEGEPAEWVWKADCGAESNTEAEKGEASDSFKRACFNWGIGRSLYTSPFIWIKAEDANISNKKCYDKFSVEKIQITNKRITGLAIRNDTLKKRVFVYCENNG